MNQSPHSPVPPSPSPEWTEISARDVLSKQPLVTIHMATYNHEAYLADAIESVAGQHTDFPFEVIIGEDCSKDNTRQIALDYQRRYPDKIRVQFGNRNLGPKGNSRRMRKLWRGKYVAWCEGDDYWSSPDKLQTQVNFLENHAEYGLVHCGFQTCIGSTVYPAVAALSPMPSGRIFEDLLARNFIATCTVCLRASIARDYEQSPFWEKNYLVGDYPLWLFVSQQSLVEYLDTPMSVYRKVAGSLTNSGFESNTRMALSNREIKLDFMAHYNSPPDVQTRARRESNLRILRSAANAGDRELFLTEYAWLRLHNPTAAKNFKLRLRWLLVILRLHKYMRLLSASRSTLPA